MNREEVLTDLEDLVSRGVTAPVNKIIPFSCVDGFGNRTAIFLQGCNQDCLYCHNPETIHLCKNCGACVKTCPAGALPWWMGLCLMILRSAATVIRVLKHVHMVHLPRYEI